MNTEPLYILNSKYNCKNKYKMNPDDIPELRLALSEDKVQSERRKYEEIIGATKHFTSKLSLYMEGIPTVFIITNDTGVIIEVFGDQPLKELFGVVPGHKFEEETAGTNSISLCLKHKQPMQIIGNQHYHHCFSGFSCTSCLFQITDDKYDQIVGTVTLMTKIDDSSYLHLGLLSSAIDSIEREVIVNVQNRKLLELNEIMINTTCNGIIITDQEGLITSINQSAEQLFNINREIYIGQPITSITQIAQYFYCVINTKGKIINDEILYENENSKNHFIIDVLPIFDQRGELIGSYGQFRDITERYKLEQQIIENEKLSTIGRLSAGLAHEIRNPLTPIIGFVRLLKTHYNDETADMYLTIMADELERIKQLVTNFVLTSKPDAPSKKNVKLFELIEQTVSFLNSEVALKNVRIKVVNCLTEVQEVSIDVNQIKQVLINLIQNAMDVTQNGGEIVISAFNNAEGISIEIKDKGVGMSKDQMDQLFSPFFSTKENGVGLGLSICERIVKNHHGKISVTSQFGEGATFTVFLPLTN